MKFPVETKPALWGIAGGAIAMAIVGFTWGGWVTGGTAETAATQRANAAVVVALAPVFASTNSSVPLTSRPIWLRSRRSIHGRKVTSSRKAVGQRFRDRRQPTRCRPWPEPARSCSPAPNSPPFCHRRPVATSNSTGSFTLTVTDRRDDSAPQYVRRDADDSVSKLATTLWCGGAIPALGNRDSRGRRLRVRAGRFGAAGVFDGQGFRPPTP